MPKARQSTRVAHPRGAPDVRPAAPVTEDTVLSWRMMPEDGRKIGHTYSQPDLFIAATAAQHGLTVVTRDRSQFDKAHIPVINPWES